MRVICDVDGVLADFIAGVCEHYEIQDPYLDAKNHGRWDVVKIIGMIPRVFWAPLGFAFWKNLPETKDCHEIYNALAKHFGEEEICFVTFPCKTFGCSEGKLNWLDKRWPNTPRLLGNDKTPCANSNSILFDDNEDNVAAFREAGGHAFLMPGPWNSKAGQDPLTALTEYLDARS